MCTGVSRCLLLFHTMLYSHVDHAICTVTSEAKSVAFTPPGARVHLPPLELSISAVPSKDFWRHGRSRSASGAHYKHRSRSLTRLLEGKVCLSVFGAFFQKPLLQAFQVHRSPPCTHHQHPSAPSATILIGTSTGIVCSEELMDLPQQRNGNVL